MPEVKFGEFLSNLPFSQEEKTRIINAFKDENSLIYKTFRLSLKSPSISDSKFCRWMAEKQLNLKGDRAGGEAQRDKLLNKCISFTQGTFQMEPAKFWAAYKILIVKYVEAKMPHLQKMLLATKVDSQQKDTKAIFQKILQLRAEYSYSLKDLQDFYELWGFDRDSSIENALFVSAHSVPSEDIEDLKSRLQEQESGFHSKLSEIKTSLVAELGQIQEQTSIISENLEAIETEYQEIAKDMNARFSSFNRTVENLRAEVKSLPDQKVIKAIRGDIKNIEEGLSKASTMIGKLLESQSKQAKELSRVNEKIGRKFLGSTAGVGQPLRKIDAGKHKISEIEFVQYWQRKLADSPFSSLQLDDLLACHLFFKTFRSFIIQDPMLYDSWIEALGWKQHSSICVAEPSWIKKEDCSELVTFVSSGESPSVLRISNFNCAMIEGYLLPQLIPWMQKEEFLDRKLALVVADGEEQVLREIVHEAPLMSSSFGRLDPAPVLSRSYPSFSSDESLFISTLSIWDNKAAPNPDEDRGLFNIIGSQDLEIPPTVINNYSKLRGSFMDYYDSKSAILAAYQFVIMPWIRYCRNDVYAEQITQSLKEVYE